MRRNKIYEIIGFFLRILIGILFLYAAIGKIDDPNAFLKEINNYRLFPELFSQIIAIFLPWFELAVGIFLVFGIRQRTTSFISLILFFSFTLIIISAWARGLNINCGCFSQSIEYVGFKKVLENIIATLISLFLFVFPKSTLSIETVLRKNLLSENDNLFF